MRRKAYLIPTGLCLLCLNGACFERRDVDVDAGAPTPTANTMQAAAPGTPSANDAAGSAAARPSEDGGIVLECKKGGAVSAVHVEFDCGSITTYTCKDLSNVVLEFADGSRQRFDAQSGHVNTFTGTGANAGKPVVGVWVKAGANFSGDGPGYGERVDAPAQDCAPPAAGSGGAGGCEVTPDGFCAQVTAGVGGAAGTESQEPE